jgi:hypothetical protein
MAAAPAADQWVLHDPRLWLGTAFHEVMSAARSSDAPIDALAVWDSAITRLVKTALEHPLDMRYAAPERWPSYFLVRQRCISLASQVPPRSASSKGTWDSSATHAAERGSERRLQAFGGLLVGRPDFYDGTTITEYKSNLPDPAWPGAASILDTFRRQMRLYAAIIGNATGRRPRNARIVAASGQTMDIPINPAECDAEAEAALGALHALNAKLVAEVHPESIACSEPANCAGCPFKMICPAFWEKLLTGEMKGLQDAVILAELLSLEDGPDGDLYTVGIRVMAASRDVFAEQQIVLRGSIHGKLPAAAVGQRCRVVGSYARADQRPRADISTLIAAVPGLPALCRPVNAAASKPE